MAGLIGYNPQLWFNYMERCFEFSKITRDAEKIAFLNWTLESEYKRLFQHFNNDPPSENTYETIKKKIIQYFMKLWQQLWNHPPSELLKLLRILFSLNGKRKKCLRCEWLNMLPTKVRESRYINGCMNLDNMSQRADAAIRLSPLSIESKNYINNFIVVKKLIKLSNEVADMVKTKELINPNQHKISCCWYHLCYGEQANKFPKPRDEDLLHLKNFSLKCSISGDQSEEI